LHYKECENDSCSVCAPILKVVRKLVSSGVSLFANARTERQRHLLSLFHASKCPLESDCPVRACATMKRVWSHASQCVDVNCSVVHCRSSRDMLEHYRSCRDINCLHCVPVRFEMRKYILVSRLRGQEAAVASSRRPLKKRRVAMEMSKSTNDDQPEGESTE